MPLDVLLPSWTVPPIQRNTQRDLSTDAIDLFPISATHARSQPSIEGE